MNGESEIFSDDEATDAIEIDPEIHEVYSGNAHFEIFKIFVKNKDFPNAYEYL